MGSFIIKTVFWVGKLIVENFVSEYIKNKVITKIKPKKK